MKQQAYKNTSVHWGKTQAQISSLLAKYGVQDTRFTFLNSQLQLICEFNYPHKENGKELMLGIRMIIPITVMKDMEQAKNQIHRALFYTLKSKFESADFNIETFIKAFMAHLVIFDKQGGSKPLHEVFIPQYIKALTAGEQGEIKLLN